MKLENTNIKAKSYKYKIIATLPIIIEYIPKDSVKLILISYLFHIFLHPWPTYVI